MANRPSELVETRSAKEEDPVNQSHAAMEWSDSGAVDADAGHGGVKENFAGSRSRPRSPEPSPGPVDAVGGRDAKSHLWMKFPSFGRFLDAYRPFEEGQYSMRSKYSIDIFCIFAFSMQETAHI